VTECFHLSRFFFFFLLPVYFFIPFPNARQREIHPKGFLINLLSLYGLQLSFLDVAACVTPPFFTVPQRGGLPGPPPSRVSEENFDGFFILAFCSPPSFPPLCSFIFFSSDALAPLILSPSSPVSPGIWSVRCSRESLMGGANPFFPDFPPSVLRSHPPSLTLLSPIRFMASNFR